MTLYTTQAGDTFDSIAYSLLGDEERMGEIIKANPKYAPVVRFDAGTVLAIPEKTARGAAALPSWRK